MTTSIYQLKFFVIITLFAFLFLPSLVFGADPKLTIRDSAYAARYVSQSIPDPIRLAPGETKEVIFRFQNVGTQTWNSIAQHPNGYRHVSAYTMEPRYRISPFKSTGWISGSQTWSVTKDVAPGQIGELKVVLTAPKKTGRYKEEFHLAVEEYSWMKGGYFYIDIIVDGAATASAAPVKETSAKTEADQTDSNTQTGAYTAKKIGQSKKDIRDVGGKEIPLVLIYQNLGKEWDGYEIQAELESSVNIDGQSIADSTWISGTVVDSDDESIGTGESIRKKVVFMTPAKQGEYTARFFLSVDGERVAGSDAEIALRVTKDAPKTYAPVYKEEATTIKKVSRLKEEPRIRVGLTTQGDAFHVVSYDDDYIIYNGDKEMGVLDKRKVGKMTYQGGVYSFDGSGVDFRTNNYIRLVPKNDPHATFRVIKGLKDRNVSWVGPSKFNKYHGAFELRVGEKDKELYVVNDLLMEDYVKGISENGRGTHIEAIKANLIAARTYAYKSLGKYPFFDVLGSTYDQLYLGAEVAEYLPDVPVAATQTRGMMVVYNDDIVITPYSGRTSGTTKSWSQVWGGSNKPWLVPVEAKYDKGYRALGHGVGMSQWDAERRAKNDGWTFDQLITHYYTGTQVEEVY